MITSIQGTLTAATPLAAIIELNGLGYEVHIPVTTAEKLPPLGQNVKLHTHVIYREDAQTLYGFASPAERDFFRLMIENVSGVGPKLAVTIMSKLSLPMLESTIRDGDIGTLSKCPGIGKKTAERLIIELRSKVTAGAQSTLTASQQPAANNNSDKPPSALNTHYRDAILALEALGYKTPDADAAIRKSQKLLGPEASTEQLIKKALGN